MTSIAPPSLSGAAGDALRPLHESGLDAVVLLGGTVRQTDFRRAIGRHILQLPIGGGRTILSRWAEQTASIARRLELPGIRVRIVLSPDEHFAPGPIDAPGASIGVETDPRPTRGTGGVLRDLVADIPDSRWLLVANANQAFIGDPLDAILRLARARADMALMPAFDGNGGFLLLTRCQCLKGIASRGFIDLKEQALPAIAGRYDLRVVDAEAGLSPTSIRSLQDYLDILPALAGAAPAGAAIEGDENEPRPFRIVETGANVAADARIHNSVVLAGGTVEPGAVVARCVVGPGGRVTRRQVARDRVVTPAGEDAGS